MILGTIATGVGTVTTIQLQYVPQYLYWNNATVLQNVRVEVVGDGLVCNLPSAGLNSVNGLGMYGLGTNDYVLPLANGQVDNKVVTLTITNGVAADITLHGFSYGLGTHYIRSQVAPIQATQSLRVKSFAWLGMPAFVTATDVLDVTFAKSKFVQRLTLEEITAMLGFWQNPVTAARAGIYNLRQAIDEVNVQVALAQSFYKVDYQPVGSLSNAIKI